jgi:hypothetical protein
MAGPSEADNQAFDLSETIDNQATDSSETVSQATCLVSQLSFLSAL